MTYRFSTLAALSIAGCTSAVDRMPVQEPGEVVAAFQAALRACSAGLTPSGSIDQAAIAATGWRAVRRRTRLGLEDRELALNAFPTLRSTEYESTEWAHAAIANRIELVRWEGPPASLLDECSVRARVRGRDEVAQVVAGMTRLFGRQPDHHGEMARGGDFLTPRFDNAAMGDYWALPRNDAYLVSGDDGHIRLDVVAMPDRNRLDQYSPDRPEHRIPTQEGTS